MKALSIALLALALAATPARAFMPETWQEDLLVDHPLVGRIFNVDSDIRPVAVDDLRDAINGSAAIAIGEIHDNRDHHRLQANLIEARQQVSSNLVAVYKGLGGGWQIRQNQEFLPATVLAEMAYRTDWGDLLQQDPTRASLN